jgi:hypothetical protein
MHGDLQHEQRDDDGEDPVAQGFDPSTADDLERAVRGVARHGSPAFRITALIDGAPPTPGEAWRR